MALDNTKLGLRIKTFRMQLRMSQEELAEKVDISLHYISRIERGVQSPSLEVLIAIANELRGSTDDLLDENLSFSHSQAGTEIHRLLIDCNHDEMKMLTKMLHFHKALLREFGI